MGEKEQLVMATSTFLVRIWEEISERLAEMYGWIKENRQEVCWEQFGE